MDWRTSLDNNWTTCKKCSTANNRNSVKNAANCNTRPMRNGWKWNDWHANSTPHEKNAKVYEDSKWPLAPISFYSSCLRLESPSMPTINGHHRRRLCSNQYHITWTIQVCDVWAHSDTTDQIVLQGECPVIQKPMEVLHRRHTAINKETSMATVLRDGFDLPFLSSSFRPIDHQRNDSGAASPAEMFRARTFALTLLYAFLCNVHRSLGPPPPPFGLGRPPFFPPFLGGPPPNPFMMGPRFPMPMPGPHGLLSPIAHLMTNGSAGGSDANSFEHVDSTNITPNSTSYDVQMNGSAASPRDDGKERRSRSNQADWILPFRWPTSNN